MDGLTHRRTAIHEAGHAVSALLNGIPINHAAIESHPDGRVNGRVMPRYRKRGWPAGSRWTPALAGTLRFYAAGWAATERWLRGRKEWSEDVKIRTQAETDGDKKNAIDISALCGVDFVNHQPKYGEVSWDLLIAAAAWQLHSHWPQVLLVANELYDREYLGGRRIQKISKMKPVNIDTETRRRTSSRSIIWLPPEVW